MELPELEVGEELPDNFIIKELIASYKERIKVLEQMVQLLKAQHSPNFNPAGNSVPERFNPPTQKPRLTTMNQVILELERRTSINPGVTSEEVTESK